MENLSRQVEEDELLYIPWNGTIDLYNMERYPADSDVMPLSFILRREKIARTFERATYAVLNTKSNHVTRSIEVVNLQNFGTMNNINNR